MTKSSYQITKEIITFLKNNPQTTMNNISKKTNFSYRVVRNSLEFLKSIKLVKEEAGTYQNNKTRIFSLSKGYAKL